MGILDQRFEKNFMISSVDYVFNWARKPPFAVDVRSGVLRDRNDRLNNIALRHRAIRAAKVPAVAAQSDL